MSGALHLNNWAQVLLEDWEGMGHPAHLPEALSAEEENHRLNLLSFAKRISHEWVYRLQAAINEWNYPQHEADNLVQEAYNQDLRSISGIDVMRN